MVAFRALLDLVFPAACAACRELLRDDESAPFCGECVRTLDVIDPEEACVRCGEPGWLEGKPCVRCELHPPSFRAAFAPFRHTGAVTRAIHRFKYEDAPELAAPLGRLLAHGAAEFLHRSGREATLIALPLHTLRFRSRRYDQAELLTRALAKVSGHRVGTNVLTRVRETRRQVGLTDVEREKNVANAFVAEASVRGRRYILVDDVLTTGATARAAATALLREGAVCVDVLALARASNE